MFCGRDKSEEKRERHFKGQIHIEHKPMSNVLRPPLFIYETHLWLCLCVLLGLDKVSNLYRNTKGIFYVDPFICTA